MHASPDAAPIRLRYRWEIAGDQAAVFHYVSDARTFTRWFPVFRAVRPDDLTGPLRVGTHVACRVKAILPYMLDWDITVTRYEPPRLIETACRLVLSNRLRLHGVVRYRFEARGPLVIVVNEQEMATDRPIPRLLRPLAQAIFRFNHDWAMRQGQAPLQRIVRLATEPAA